MSRMTKADRASAIGALKEAVEKAGGTQAALARALKCSRANVNLMLSHGRVTPERIKQIESLYGIERKRLAPHIYG